MINPKCPKCGGQRVQLTHSRSKHGCLWLFLFGMYYVFYVIYIKWMIGLMLFLFYDWWMAIVHSSLGKGHIWQCRKWFSGRKRVFYCHECGYNFRY